MKKEEVLCLVTYKKIGKALMVPVAVLPAAAILMGIGYWIDPVGWGANSQLAAIFNKSRSCNNR